MYIEYGFHKNSRYIVNHSIPKIKLQSVTVNINIKSKKSLKIPKRQSESVYRRRTDNTMAKRKGTKGQTTIYKEFCNYSIYF
jgi:hypothetical protein